MSNTPITQIRPMTDEDAAAMLAIYAPFVRDTAVSFEDAVPSLAEFTSRVGKWLASWAGLVALRDNELVGYAYASAHRERAAYRWSVETTVYVASGCHRAGVGRALYQSLLPALEVRGFRNAYAGSPCRTLRARVCIAPWDMSRSAYSGASGTSSDSGTTWLGFTVLWARKLWFQDPPTWRRCRRLAARTPIPPIRWLWSLTMWRWPSQIPSEPRLCWPVCSVARCSSRPQ